MDRCTWAEVKGRQPKTMGKQILVTCSNTAEYFALTFPSTSTLWP